MVNGYTSGIAMVSSKQPLFLLCCQGFANLLTLLAGADLVRIKCNGPISLTWLALSSISRRCATILIDLASNASET